MFGKEQSRRASGPDGFAWIGMDARRLYVNNIILRVALRRAQMNVVFLDTAYCVKRERH